MFTITTFNIFLEIPARATRQEKDVKGNQIGKEEVKLSFADNILHIEHPKDCQKWLELMHEFSKFVGNKNQTQILAAFLYTNNEL